MWNCNIKKLQFLLFFIFNADNKLLFNNFSQRETVQTITVVGDGYVPLNDSPKRFYHMWKTAAEDLGMKTCQPEAVVG